MRIQARGDPGCTRIQYGDVRLLLGSNADPPENVKQHMEIVDDPKMDDNAFTPLIGGEIAEWILKQDYIVNLNEYLGGSVNRVKKAIGAVGKAMGKERDKYLLSERDYQVEHHNEYYCKMALLRHKSKQLEAIQKHKTGKEIIPIPA